MTEFTIENIVVSTSLADSLNLNEVAKILPDTTYNPQETPAVILHKTVPTKAVVMIYANGILMCTGTKTLHDAEIIIHTTTKILYIAGLSNTETPELNIQTLVASYELQKHLNLRAVAKALTPRCNVEYNPTQFPGLIYKKADTKTVVLLFETGKMICTATTVEDVSRAIETVIQELSTCKKI